jgi:hypothetical protein
MRLELVGFATLWLSVTELRRAMVAVTEFGGLCTLTVVLAQNTGRVAQITRRPARVCPPSLRPARILSALATILHKIA